MGCQRTRILNVAQQTNIDYFLCTRHKVVATMTSSQIELYLENEENLDEEESEEEEEYFPYIDILDAPRELPEPREITPEIINDISTELGLIKLCWPTIDKPEFENRLNFPKHYTTNSNKEKLLLLYAENFRRQFCHRFPKRKPLYLASENECGLQVSLYFKLKAQ